MDLHAQFWSLQVLYLASAKEVDAKIEQQDATNRSSNPLEGNDHDNGSRRVFDTR